MVRALLIEKSYSFKGLELKQFYPFSLQAHLDKNSFSSRLNEEVFIGG